MPYLYTDKLDPVMENMPFGYLRGDGLTNIVHSNGYLEKNYGLTFDDLKGTAWQNLLHPQDKARLLLYFAKEIFFDQVTLAAARFVTPVHKEVPFLLIIDALMNEKNRRIGYLIYVIDVSLPLHDLCKISAQGMDILTHLNNRAVFLSKLEEVLMHKREKNSRCALFLVDFYGFDKFNHLWGYELGDKLLEKLAVILKKECGDKYLLGRIESDKFGVMVETFEDQAELHEIVEKFYAACNQTVRLSQGKFTLAVSIGVAITAAEDSSLDLLLRHAYEALGTAKRNEPRIDYLSEENYRSYQRVRRIAESLFDAIAQNQFELHYQPQVDTQNHKVVGIEVLMRWRHPELGIIEPDEFISIAEETGFIVHIGKWVKEHALEQFALWKKELNHKMDGIKLSINLSPLQLMDENLISDLKGMLKNNKIDPSAIILEMTETTLMKDRQKSIHVLNELSDLGIHLSMDDFGTGYSSLNYLRFLPISQVKIDRSFVKAFHNSRRDAAVVKHTISLAEALGMDVVAEGVETEEELKFLRKNGCHIIQGYYYSHPLNAQGMEEYILANT